MKRVILFMGLVFLFCISSFSQVFVKDIDINKLDIKYCKIVGQRKLLGLKAKITVDFGQPRKNLWNAKIKDKDGKVMEFMEKNGWEYVDDFAITKGDKNVYYLLLRKKKKLSRAESKFPKALISRF
jgi:hypothetical protein